MLTELGVLLALAAAPARHASITVTEHPSRPEAVLTYRGRVRTRRGDRFVLYLARRCEPTVARARRHYVVAYDRSAPGRGWTFRGALGKGSVHPRTGRMCLMVASRSGRRLLQPSARYSLA